MQTETDRQPKLEHLQGASQEPILMDKDPDIVRQHPVIYDASGRDETSRREQLIAAGRLIPGKARLAELGPPVDLPYEISISEALDEQRSSS